ncbi:Glycosyl transferases group 1 [Carpediemonas membranifera]|uniref:Alpha-1,3/1,6-mannosyltransferase ALG2 n=1 Tax=Carpediemonas membranifera TaxID=201153 RepID=A0A8J6DZB7_9EUKA|nr:Glycosyl transferases group 1 [Carpediemonas membranifera]|eukprot:KAG9390206.1 Glycosyl transferases group 1 [Carpediemonas membranifera]
MPLNVAFIHPNLGIGGAERLVVDTALGLHDRGHRVHIYTAHHDASHCFDEVHPETGVIPVSEMFHWFPDSIFGRFRALCVYIRMILVALNLVFFKRSEYDIFFVDQVSACIPFLKLAWRSKVVFYGHFPDMLLTDRRTLPKKLYRGVLDKIEEVTTGMADRILVNSKFTEAQFSTQFPRVGAKGRLVIAYPPVHIGSMVGQELFDTAEPENAEPSSDYQWLSINRYEGKKRVDIAIRALAEVKVNDPRTYSRTKLTIAGGYDDLVRENRDVYSELCRLAKELGVAEHVQFLRNIGNDEKMKLLREATVLMYTPSGEHFGIVPVEAMASRLPVIAVNNGGPTESICVERGSETGFLVDQTPEAFAEAALSLARTEGLRDRMGSAGASRVATMFSMSVYIDVVETEMRTLTGRCSH